MMNIINGINMIIFERHKELEEKIGVEIENLSINIKKTEISNEEYHVYGEFNFNNVDNYTYITFEAIFYDINENILKTSSSLIDLNGFLGHGTFSFWGYEPLEELNKINKIKIFPQSLTKKYIKNYAKSKDKITLENEDLVLKIGINKDYSRIRDFDDRKNEFANDVQDIVNEYIESEEINEFINYYD